MRLGEPTNPTGEEHAFSLDAARMRTMIKAQQALERRAARGLLNPSNSLFLKVWDVLTTSALVYTAFVTPFEIGFFPSDSPSWTMSDKEWAWFYVNRIIDIIFLLDMILQFFTMIPVPNPKDNFTSSNIEDAAKKLYTGPTVRSSSGVVYIASIRRLARDYVCSRWFPVDVLSLLPSVLELGIKQYVHTSYARFKNMAKGSEERRAQIRSIKLVLDIVRCTRLVKLVRIIKFRRTYNRIAAHISITHSTALKIKVPVSVICVVHWFACVFALLSNMQTEPQKTYWGTAGFCDDLLVASSGPALALVQACQITEGEFYVACFTWAMLIVTGTGGADSFPSATSVPENIVVTLLNMVAALFWTTVLALYCDMISNGSPLETESQQILDELEVFMSNHDIPREMRVQLREYFHQRKHIRIAESAFAVTRQLSTKLQIDVVTLVFGPLLYKVPFLRACEKMCLTTLALALRPMTFAPTESPPPDHFYIVKKGIVQQGARLIKSGNYFGEEVILQSPPEEITVQCNTYVDAFAISREELWELLDRFPNDKRNVRKSAAWLALRLELRRMSVSFQESTEKATSFFADKLKRCSYRRASAPRFSQPDPEQAERAKMPVSKNGNGLPPASPSSGRGLVNGAAAAGGSAEIQAMRATLDQLVARMDTMGAKFDALFEARRSRTPSRRKKHGSKRDVVSSDFEDA